MTITQNARLLGYLKKYGNITQIEALTELGIFRLASRINDLKNKGHNIIGQMVDVENRFGEKVKIKRYFLTENY
jgi:hypothetical protein